MRVSVALDWNSLSVCHKMEVVESHQVKGQHVEDNLCTLVEQSEGTKDAVI